MAYDANVPADNLAISAIPGAIKQKGADVKALVDTHTGAATGAHADTAISAAVNGVLPVGTVRSQLAALDVTQATAKTSLADADLVGLNDSAAANAKKKITWANFKTAILGVLLTGLSTATATAVTATDSILVGIGKLQAQINGMATTIRGTVLTGLSTATATVVAATDTILVAIGKLQAQVTARLSLSGGAMTGAINEASASVASAATCDIGAAAGNFVTITGTTTITALGTVQAGTRRHVRFAGALTLTHNATSLILPGGASITTAAGDTATVVSLGSGNWVCIDYQRANGQALVGGVVAGQVVQVVSVTKSDTFVATPGVNVWADITGMAATITPGSTANKILVLVSLQICRGGTSMLITQLLRGSTPVAVGDTAGSRPRASSSTTGGNDDYTPQSSVISYLDSPATTAATTYKMQAQSLFVNDGIWVNRTAGDGDNVNHARFASTITLMEVKG